MSPEVYDVEGEVSYGWSRRYERSQANRALAIELHGRTCAVCGFNFDDCYGTLAGGYVEIHHLVPVSSMDVPKVVDPRTDLVPLCANCHRMAHRRWPPYTPTELQASRHPNS
ncbi:HNH endonuclease [Arthrobacter sp. YD4]|uniref:HNH endonuclease n=1 Tax=Arthrobacter sp. YD4 TaxID=3058043 RepID=UPI0025B491A1|nr:HNH endonuclease [Arthrobacter sp. YD4]MDN3937546.1 HNH endonuclease [Arthrobacter sp. YD4]